MGPAGSEEARLRLREYHVPRGHIQSVQFLQTGHRLLQQHSQVDVRQQALSHISAQAYQFLEEAELRRPQGTWACRAPPSTS